MHDLQRFYIQPYLCTYKPSHAPYLPNPVKLDTKLLASDNKTFTCNHIIDKIK